MASALATTVESSTFRRLSIVATGTGVTKTKITTASATSMATLAFNSTDGQNSKLSVSTSDDDHTLLVCIKYPEAKSYSLFSWMGFGKTGPESELHIALPEDLKDFYMEANIGSLDWNAVNVTSSFKAKINLGTVATDSSICCKNADIRVNVGSIHLKDLSALNDVSLEADVGKLSGLIRSYKSLTAETGVGDMRFTLHPSTEASNTRLTCGTGSIAATVFGFSGRLNSHSGLGRVKIYGVDSDRPFDAYGPQKFQGWVSKRMTDSGEFEASTGLGKVKLTFQ
ncbi:hypothetical protein BC830DRAFT_1117235 [Chytriomyces sp. MP71]|nr:hypothetical protein BC830DRAFT_1117235 [Chytriomyces sp. MP71]